MTGFPCFNVPSLRLGCVCWAMITEVAGSCEPHGLLRANPSPNMDACLMSSLVEEQRSRWEWEGESLAAVSIQFVKLMLPLSIRSNAVAILLCVPITHTICALKNAKNRGLPRTKFEGYIRHPMAEGCSARKANGLSSSSCIFLFVLFCVDDSWSCRQLKLSKATSNKEKCC